MLTRLAAFHRAYHFNRAYHSSEAIWNPDGNAANLKFVEGLLVTFLLVAPSGQPWGSACII